ncbi:MAG: hypothetical protein ACTSPY_06545 [Candidatus Helarchaeota archaeon]
MEMNSRQKFELKVGIPLLAAGLILYAIFIVNYLGSFFFIPESLCIFGIVYFLSALFNFNNKSQIIALFLVFSGIMTVIVDLVPQLDLYFLLLSAGWIFGLIWIGTGIAVFLITK